MSCLIQWNPKNVIVHKREKLFDKRIHEDTRTNPKKN